MLALRWFTCWIDLFNDFDSVTERQVNIGRAHGQDDDVVMLDVFHHQLPDLRHNVF